MRNRIVVAMCAAFLGCVSLATGAPLDAQGGTTLARLRDVKRVVLVFARGVEDARVVEQMRELESHAAEGVERDLVGIVVPEVGAGGLTAADAVEARQRFHARAGAFVVVLVGKDGGEKLRSGAVIPFERLRTVIDAMPMRQAEMRERR